MSTTISASIRSGCFNATSIAVLPPTLWPSTIAGARLFSSISASRSSAISAKVMLSAQGEAPWLRRSQAKTR